MDPNERRLRGFRFLRRFFDCELHRDESLTRAKVAATKIDFVLWFSASRV
jgi:hypothetical protein